MLKNIGKLCSFPSISIRFRNHPLHAHIQAHIKIPPFIPLFPLHPLLPKQPLQPLHPLLPPPIPLIQPHNPTPTPPPPPLRPHHLPPLLPTQRLQHRHNRPLRIRPVSAHMPHHHLNANPLIHIMPAVIIRTHAHERIRHFGFAEELALRHGGHVYDADWGRGGEGAVEEGFGAGAELGAFDAD